jgi:hypothetical protein
MEAMTIALESPHSPGSHEQVTRPDQGIRLWQYNIEIYRTYRMELNAMQPSADHYTIVQCRY